MLCEKIYIPFVRRLYEAGGRCHFPKEALSGGLTWSALHPQKKYSDSEKDNALNGAAVAEQIQLATQRMNGRDGQERGII